MLFGQDRADEPDQGVAVGEDPDNVGAAADLPVESLLRIVRPDLPPVRPREGGESQQFLYGVGEQTRGGADRPGS